MRKVKGLSKNKKQNSKNSSRDSSMMIVRGKRQWGVVVEEGKGRIYGDGKKLTWDGKKVILIQVMFYRIIHLKPI